MPENLMSPAHKANSEVFRRNYDRIFTATHLPATNNTSFDCDRCPYDVTGGDCDGQCSAVKKGEKLC